MQWNKGWGNMNSSIAPPPATPHPTTTTNNKRKHESDSGKDEKKEAPTQKKHRITPIQRDRAEGKEEKKKPANSQTGKPKKTKAYLSAQLALMIAFAKKQRTAFSCIRDPALLMCGAYTGLRRLEMCRLECGMVWDCVNDRPIDIGVIPARILKGSANSVLLKELRKAKAALKRAEANEEKLRSSVEAPAAAPAVLTPEQLENQRLREEIAALKAAAASKAAEITPVTEREHRLVAQAALVLQKEQADRALEQERFNTALAEAQRATTEAQALVNDKVQRTRRRRNRLIAICPRLQEALRPLCQGQPANRMVFRKNGSSDEALDECWASNKIGKMAIKVLGKVDGANKCLHGLKKMYAKACREAFGGDLMKVRWAIDHQGGYGNHIDTYLIDDDDAKPLLDVIRSIKILPDDFEPAPAIIPQPLQPQPPQQQPILPAPQLDFQQMFNAFMQQAMMASFATMQPRHAQP